MASGDVTHAEVEGFLQLGYPFPTASDSTMTESEADACCNSINAEVNLWLKRLGFSLPITNTDDVTWLQFTKTLGSSAYILDGLMAQDSEQDNTRAKRLWDMYEQRLQTLRDTNGEILQTERDSGVRPTNLPMVVGEYSSGYGKAHMRFPQRAAADQYDDEIAINESGGDWASAIRGL